VEERRRRLEETALRMCSALNEKTMKRRHERRGKKERHIHRRFRPYYYPDTTTSTHTRTYLLAKTKQHSCFSLCVGVSTLNN
jgi:hypothetical protein